MDQGALVAIMLVCCIAMCMACVVGGYLLHTMDIIDLSFITNLFAFETQPVVDPAADETEGVDTDTKSSSPTSGGDATKEASKKPPIDKRYIFISGNALARIQREHTSYSLFRSLIKIPPSSIVKNPREIYPYGV